MIYFPMMYQLQGRLVLICGGATHAYEKIIRLQPFGANIQVIAASISDQIKACKELSIYERSFLETDLDKHPVFVIAAEEERENIRIASLCRSHHIPVNVVDMPQYCDFIFPSMHTSEQLCVAVSTGGASPSTAILLKERIASSLPVHLDDILLWLAAIRPEIKEAKPDAYKAVMRCLAAAAMKQDRPLSKAELDALISNK